MSIISKYTKNSTNKTNDDTLYIEELLENTEILFAISKTIKDYRRENNLTQKELAQMLKMKQVMISKLESGKYNPTLKMLHKISRQLTNSSKLFVDMLALIQEQLSDMYVVKYTTENNYIELKLESSIEKTIIFSDYNNLKKGDECYEENGKGLLSIA